MKMTAMPHLLMPSAAGGAKLALLLFLCLGQGQMLRQVKPYLDHSKLLGCTSLYSQTLYFSASQAAKFTAFALDFTRGFSGLSRPLQSCADAAFVHS